MGKQRRKRGGKSGFVRKYEADHAACDNSYRIPQKGAAVCSKEAVEPTEVAEVVRIQASSVSREHDSSPRPAFSASAVADRFCAVIFRCSAHLQIAKLCTVDEGVCQAMTHLAAPHTSADEHFENVERPAGAGAICLICRKCDVR